MHLPIEGKSGKIISIVGMATSWIIEIAVVYAFFTAISREWVMWIAGPMFTFFGIWNFVMIWTGSKNTYIKTLHTIAWVATVIVVLQAAVSYGLAQGEVSNNAGSVNVESYVKELTSSRTTAQTYYDSLLTKNIARGEDSLRNRSQDEKDIAAAKKALDEVDAKLSPYITKAQRGESYIEVNAQLVFKQLYGDKWREALGIFFLIFGLLMETTLSLSAFYSFRKKEETNDIQVTIPIINKADTKPILPPNKPKNSIKSKRKVKPKTVKVSPKKDTIPTDNILSIEAEDSVEQLSAPPIDEEELIHKVKKNFTEVYIKSLFNNGTNTYLRERDEAAEESDVPKIEALKIFEFLTHTKHEGTLFVEFRKETGKYHPNVTSEWILSYIRSNNIIF